MLRNLRKKFREKTKKQLTFYSIASSVTNFLLLGVFIRFAINYHLDETIFLIILSMYVIFMIIIAILFGSLIEYAKLRERQEWSNSKIKELFKGTKSFTIVLSENADHVYKKIIDRIEVQEKTRFLDCLDDYNEKNCKIIVDKMIENNEINFIAELIDEYISITIRYKDSICSNTLKCFNYEWFEKNFLIKE